MTVDDRCLWHYPSRSDSDKCPRLEGARHAGPPGADDRDFRPTTAPTVERHRRCNSDNDSKGLWLVWTTWFRQQSHHFCGFYFYGRPAAGEIVDRISDFYFNHGQSELRTRTRIKPLIERHRRCNSDNDRNGLWLVWSHCGQRGFHNGATISVVFIF